MQYVVELHGKSYQYLDAFGKIVQFRGTIYLADYRTGVVSYTREKQGALELPEDLAKEYAFAFGGIATPLGATPRNVAGAQPRTSTGATPRTTQTKPRISKPKQSGFKFGAKKPISKKKKKGFI